MNNTTATFSKGVWIGLGLIAATLAVIVVLLRFDLAAERARPMPVLGQVADFTLTNQAGRAVTLADLRGRVWVADIIFTRCAGPCPLMTRRMKELQDALPADSRARLITLTTDADFDTPPVLRAYGERFGADFARWEFLTGAKREIASLAIASLKLTAVATKPEERTDPADLFVHSTFFVVVDKQARLRGVFETVGEGIEFPRVKARVLAAIAQLEHEP